MRCENCGSSDIKEKVIEGYSIMECQICGNLQGNPDIVLKIKEIQEAKESGIDPIIYPLYKILKKLPTFKIEFACAGYPNQKVPPYITFSLKEEGLKYLENIVKSIIEANKETKFHWLLEVTYQKKLAFILKPDFHHDPYDISMEQVSISQKDIPILKEKIEKNM